MPQKVLLFIDQEKGDIKTTLHNIRMLLGGGHASVIWTGHGHHIYLPMLLANKEFINNEELTFAYLRFIERRVSNYQNDKAHYPALRNSMMRIPFSYNSKCVSEGSDNFEVKIIQKWDGCRVTPDKTLFEEFIAFKDRLRLKELKQEIVQTKQVNQIKEANKQNSNKVAKDPLKEFLIFESAGISDGRKNILYYVISRYLIRERYLAPETAEAICHDWLARCNQIRKLKDTSHYLKYHIKHCIKDAINRNRESMPVEILKDYSVEAYNRLIEEYEHYNQSRIWKLLPGGVIK